MSVFEDAVIQRIKQLEREVERLQKWERAADLGLGKLSDPNADRVLFWDDSAGALKWLTVEGIVDTDLGKWQSWTPSVTSASGTITSYSASGYYCKIGKVVYCTMSISITDNGTGSGAIITSVPVSVSGFAVGAGRDNAKSGAMLQLYATGTEIRIFDYKNYYPAVTDSVLYCSINYAAA